MSRNFFLSWLKRSFCALCNLNSNHVSWLTSRVSNMQEHKEIPVVQWALKDGVDFEQLIHSFKSCPVQPERLSSSNYPFYCLVSPVQRKNCRREQKLSLVINCPTWSRLNYEFFRSRSECASKEEIAKKKVCSRWLHRPRINLDLVFANTPCLTISRWVIGNVRPMMLRSTLKYLPSPRRWKRRTLVCHSTVSSRHQLMRRRRRWGTLLPSPLTPRCEWSSTSGCRNVLERKAINVIRLHNIRSLGRNCRCRWLI